MPSDGTDKLERYLASQPAPEGDAHSLLSDVAYHRLLDAIRHAGLKPGETISKNRLSHTLGISRTPIREAIQRLVQEGLIEAYPGRMFAVAAPSFRDVLNAIDIRQRLEPWMASLVAGNLPPDAQQILRETLATMAEEAARDNRAAWSKADTVYHELLSRHCPNTYLGEIVLQARNRVLRTITDDYATRQYVIDGTEEHRLIAEAIIEGDGERAEGLMRAHIQHVRDSMLNRLT